MSTKLSHGYRLAEGTDLFTFCGELRAALDPVRDRLDAALLARKACGSIDRAHFGIPGHRADENAQLGPVMAAWLAYEDEQSKLKPLDLARDPHRFELTIAFDAETGRHMLLRFSEADALVAAFEAMPAVEKWGYWNNTDRPDTVTAEEWEARRAAWDRIVPRHSTPAESMLTFRLRSDVGPSLEVGVLDPDKQMLLDNLPTPKGRAGEVLQDAIFRRMFVPGADPYANFGKFRAAGRLAAEHHELIVAHLPAVTAATLNHQYVPDQGAADAARAALNELAERIVTEVGGHHPGQPSDAEVPA